MISQIFDRNSFKVLSLFALSPGSRFRRQEIKNRTMMHNIPLDEALSKLLMSELIKRDSGFYSINFDNKYTERIIDVVSSQHNEMKKLPLGVYFILIDLIYDTHLSIEIEMWLFGSYSKLIYNDKSDIDIAVLASEEFRKDTLKKTIRKLEGHYKKKIEIHFFEKKKFYKNKRDPLVKEILQHGIKLK
ncbi:MAG: nucleotidyltransferase domain-containing protein [Candidatus Aenigmatarchaeota archaeon]